MDASPVTGLILTGGGARAAYQVGVLKAVARIRRNCDGPTGNPFDVIAGTSAGAINAATLACRADNFDEALATLVDTWSDFSVDQVYRSDSFGVVQTGARWLTMLSIGWVLAKWRRARPRSFLDNSPLRELLTKLVPVERLQDMMSQGHLKALAVSASGYGSGMHVTFYDDQAGVQPWNRSQRIAMRQTITIEHLMASSAIPFVFPAVALGPDGGREFFGDGSMRRSRRRCIWALSASWSSVQGACTSRWFPPKCAPVRPNTPTWRRSPAMRCRASFWMHWRSTSNACSASTRRCRCCHPKCAGAVNCARSRCW